jgi:hypothetical protein
LFVLLVPVVFMLPPVLFMLFMLFILPPMLALLGLLALPPVMLALLALVPVVLVFVVPVVLVVPVVVVVVVLDVFMLFALPVVFVLSVVVQPAQKTATVSRAKRAKVLRIEFSPVTQWVNVLGAVRAFSATDRQGLPQQLSQCSSHTGYRSAAAAIPGGHRARVGMLNIHNR